MDEGTLIKMIGIFRPSRSTAGIIAAQSLLFFAISLHADPGNGRPGRQDHPSAQEIVDRAAARAEQQYQAGIEAHFESDVLASVASLDGNHDVTGTEMSRMRQYPLQGALYEELIEKDGRPLNKKELREEEKKKKKFLREVQKRKEEGKHPQPESGPDVRFNPEFVQRYSFELTGTESLRGHLCWVIDFEPREGKLPVNRSIDRALNQSTGRFWIAQEDYGLVRLEFALRKPFKYLGGLVAVIRNTDGILEFERVEADAWLPIHFDLKLDLKVMLFKNIRKHFTKEWSGHKRSLGLAETM
jgi:hypothetical protein